MYELLRCRIGFYLRAIRDDEEAAQAMGVHTVRWKLFAFTVTSMLAGLAGALYGHYIGLLSPIVVKFNEMALIIIMVCTGGIFPGLWGAPAQYGGEPHGAFCSAGYWLDAVLP